jgi:hypothetical protein
MPHLKQVFGYNYDGSRSRNPVSEFLPHGHGKLLAATTQSQSMPMSRQIAVMIWGEGGRSFRVISNSKYAASAAMGCR